MLLRSMSRVCPLRPTGLRLYSQVRLDPTIDTPLHVPVMSAEVLRNLQPVANGLYVDMTFGAGGHTRQILDSAPGVRIVALDRDEDAHSLALELQHQYPNQIIPVLGRFSGESKSIKYFKDNSNI